MELSEKAKVVVDEFIEFIKNADRGSEFVRLDYLGTHVNDIPVLRMRRNGCIEYRYLSSLLKDKCIFSFLSLQEMNTVMQLGFSKRFWTPNPSKDELVKIKFYSGYINVRKETAPENNKEINNYATI